MNEYIKIFINGDWIGVCRLSNAQGSVIFSWGMTPIGYSGTGFSAPGTPLKYVLNNVLKYVLINVSMYVLINVSMYFFFNVMMYALIISRFYAK
jgi:hypothetical protein